MFSFTFEKRMIYILIGILALSSIVNYMNNPAELFNFLLCIPGVLVAITFHEFAHGFAAYKLGDNTAKNEGRLSLNPFDHLDPLGTAMMIFAGFGWGKPVNVNPRNYTRKISMEKGEAIVSLAGPLMNFLLAIVFSIIYFAIYKFSSEEFLSTTIGGIILALLYATVSVNMGLGVFNLIPLPPLDGSKIIRPFLPYTAKEWFTNNEQIFYIVFVLTWVTGIAGSIISPIIQAGISGVMNLARIIFGV